MNPMTAPLAETLDALGSACSGVSDASGLSPADLIAVVHALGALRRRSDALQAELAAVVAERSRPELGAAGLAKEQGFRSPAQLLSVATGSSAGDAARFVRVGEATATRIGLAGEAQPAKYPHVQEALAAGAIGMPAASAIITFFDRMPPRVPRERVAEAESLLVERAPGLSTEQLGKLIVRAEAHFDQDGVTAREEEHRGARSLSIYQRNGMLHINRMMNHGTALNHGAELIRSAPASPILTDRLTCRSHDS